MSSKSGTTVTPQQKQQQLKEIASIVRALVTSRKPPCLLREVLNEYPAVENKQLPFRYLGYQSAEELLRDTGEFIISRLGRETCIALKAKVVSGAAASARTTTTNHDSNATPQRKTNKSHQLTQAKQARQPNRTDKSWNKSSYSTNVFQKLPQSANRFATSYVRLNGSGGGVGDRNNNNNNTNHIQQKESKKNQAGSKSKKSSEASDVKDLRDMLNSKQKQPRPILGNNNKQQQQAEMQPRPKQQPNKSQQQPQQQQSPQPASEKQQQPVVLPPKRQQQQPQQREQNHQIQTNQRVPLNNYAVNYQKLSVQDRLKLKIASNGGGEQSQLQHKSTSGNESGSTGSTPDSSPIVSSAGTEQQYQPNFNRTKHHSSQQQQSQPQRVEVNQQQSYPPKIFQFNPTLDPITSLSQYCVVRRCSPPEYSVLRSKFSRLYQCRVQVNGSIFSTYPNEYSTEILAKVCCAQIAIEQIQLQESRRPLPPCTDSDSELIEKLYNELLEHPYGIIAKNMSEWFESKFEQTIPEQWWTLVQTSKKFITETAAGNNVIIFANKDAENDEIETSTVIQIDGIKLPWTQKYWQLYVTHGMSTVEVWARLFGEEYSEKLDNLMADIDMYMMTEKVRPLSIASNQIYLVCISECWHRVRVGEVDKVNGIALCFFIDFGDTDSLPVNQLYYCNPKFLKLPAQAVPFSLFGLEDFAENPNARRHLDIMLPSKAFVAEILTKECDFYNSEAGSNDRIRVVLYDTSTQEDVNLNPLLLNAICNDTPLPELKRNGVTNVVVTHITEKGDVYLQIMNTELKYIQKLMQQLIESKFKQEQHKITRDDLKRSNIFLICEEEGTDGAPAWYRGALNDNKFHLNDEYFDILYVDHGITKRTHISKIFRLESLSAALSKFPRQAIKIRLHNIPETTKSIVGRMHGLLPINCQALVKLVKSGEVPSVTIYRRHEGSGTLSNVNDVIRIEHELESCSDMKLNEENGKGGSQLNADAKSNGHTSSSSNSSFLDMTRGIVITTSVPNTPQKSGVLSKLKEYEGIPVVGKFFEVRVAMSANPSNFVIQPYEDYPRLRDMMMELQDYCENNDEFIPSDMVEKGQAYAVKNPDGFYHRVTVVNTYNGDMIHVCFCDFGDIAIIRCDQLKILPAKFRHLPKMAIQSKLHGITARFGDWTLEDCLRFRELTVGQKFVCVIKDITYEKSANGDNRVLEMELIDVTTDEDIYIHEVLLKENRAIIEKSINGGN